VNENVKNRQTKMRMINGLLYRLHIVEYISSAEISNYPGGSSDHASSW